MLRVLLVFQLSWRSQETSVAPTHLSKQVHHLKHNKLLAQIRKHLLHPHTLPQHAHHLQHVTKPVCCQSNKTASLFCISLSWQEPAAAQYAFGSLVRQNLSRLLCPHINSTQYTICSADVFCPKPTLCQTQMTRSVCYAGLGKQVDHLENSSALIKVHFISGTTDCQSGKCQVSISTWHH